MKKIFIALIIIMISLTVTVKNSMAVDFYTLEEGTLGNNFDYKEVRAWEANTEAMHTANKPKHID